MAKPLIHFSVLLQCRLAIAIVAIAVAGCEGKSLVDDNPVFTAAPPRESLTNRSSVARAQDEGGTTDIQAVSFASAKGAPLTGNSVVAEVNGTPIFVDDLIGSLRLAIEADPGITAEQRQQILHAQVRGRLESFVEQEVVLQALNQTVAADRQKLIDESLEAPFQEVIGNIKRDRGLETNAQLDEALAGEGLSIDLLRESYIRIQKVQGYLSTLATVSDTVDRVDLVQYYKDHLEEYTNPERVRWQELTVLFSSHGGREGAEQVMSKAVKELQSSADFADVAVKYSDALSAEKRGDMGWLQRGGLSDKELEKQLFELKVGQMTRVLVRDDRFEVYRVMDHEFANTTPFGEVQQEIEQKIRQQRQTDARKKLLDDLKAKATVVTMFDDPPKDEPAPTLFPDR